MDKSEIIFENGNLYLQAGRSLYIYRLIPETPLEIFNKSTFLADNLRNEGQLYSDRIYQWREPIPEGLRDAALIMTRNDDKNTTGGWDFLEFDIEQAGTVYLALDERIAVPPVWLLDWERTELRLHTDDGDSRRILYRRHYPAGRVSLGPNRDSWIPVSDDISMYSVLFVSDQAAAEGWELYE